MTRSHRDPAHITVGGWPAWLLMTNRVYAAPPTDADYQAARRNSLTAAVRALPVELLRESYWHCFRRLMDSNGRFTDSMLAQFFPRTSGDPRV